MTNMFSLQLVVNDILDSNLIPRESFNDEFFKLIGDILVDIIDRQEGDIVEPINRENSSH